MKVDTAVSVMPVVGRNQHIYPGKRTIFIYRYMCVCYVLRLDEDSSSKEKLWENIDPMTHRALLYCR